LVCAAIYRGMLYDAVTGRRFTTPGTVPPNRGSAWGPAVDHSVAGNMWTMTLLGLASLPSGTEAAIMSFATTDQSTARARVARALTGTTTVMYTEVDGSAPIDWFPGGAGSGAWAASLGDCTVGRPESCAVQHTLAGGSYTGRGYKNGGTAKATAAVTGTPPAIDTLNVGGHASSGGTTLPWDGTLSHVYLWRRPLTESEIARLHCDPNQLLR
jgi:hypothetical protein